MSVEGARASLGVLGIVPLKGTPILSLDRPATRGEAAKDGARAGLAPLGWWQRLLAFDPLTFIAGTFLGAAITPLSASIGAVYGAVAGTPTEELNRAVSALEAANLAGC
jgi:hypothetical protein